MVTDKFGRSVGKLRISLTDRCNMKCLYCMPEYPIWKEKNEILTLEDIFAIAEIFVSKFKVKEIRLTGGEPLLRKNAIKLVEWLNNLRYTGLERISMTTNGLLLKNYVDSLKIAGLDDLNISLDSLKPETFYKVTGCDVLNNVLTGIDKAKQANFHVKINTVLIKGINDTEIEELINWGINKEVEIRFIEFMPLGNINWWSKEKVVTMNEILEVISKQHKVQNLESKIEEPARRFLIDNKLKLGIIATVSNPFCQFCDRIRLTADGKIILCLFTDFGYDIKKLLKASKIDEIEEVIKIAWQNKPQGFIAIKDKLLNTIPMYAIGG